MVLQIIPIIWHSVRPSRVEDMPAVVNTFWIRKGYDGLTFFGKILTPTQAEADRFNSWRVESGKLKENIPAQSHDSTDILPSSSTLNPISSPSLKNHEMIHLRQAQSTGDSWLRFYLLYIWYWLRALPMSRQLRHAGYLLNPFEMEAYGRMHEMDYLTRCENGATEWRRYAKMSLKERLKIIYGTK